MFRITTKGTGFHIDFANGFTVSVQFGPATYSDHVNTAILTNGKLAQLDPALDGHWNSTTAEIAVIRTSQSQQRGIPIVYEYRAAEQAALMLALVSTWPNEEWDFDRIDHELSCLGYQTYDTHPLGIVVRDVMRAHLKLEENNDWDY